MLRKTISEFPKEIVTSFGSQKTAIRWFRRPEESTHFMLRRFDIEAGGFIGVHAHPEEHQMYILKGPIVLLDQNNKETVVQADEFIYMPPNEPHGYKNPNTFGVAFLCGIPKLEKKK